MVESGWDLNELRPAAMSLEEIFLQLTRRGDTETPAAGSKTVAQGERPMRNIWIICRKELHSYFVSPVAYLLLTMFALIFGFFFWNALGYFILAGMESQMRGQAMPMNINEDVIRPLLSNISVIGLFFIPMITMRLFAEEKRTGTIELLATSPIRDVEIIIGKWLAAVMLYAVHAAVHRDELRVPVPLRQSRLEAAGDRLSGLAAAGRRRCWPSARSFPR